MGIMQGLGQCITAGVMLAFVGGVIGVAFFGGTAHDAAIGALIGGAIAVLSSLFGVCLGGGRRKSAETGTIVSVTADSQPGGPSSGDAYVIIDFQGRQRRLKLSPAQALDFAHNYRAGDKGEASFSGDTLLDFTPVSAAASGRKKAGNVVYISYARGSDRERNTATYLIEVLETAGLQAWIDRSDVLPWDQPGAELLEKIRLADYFIPLLSREYLTSEWCLREFETAARARLPMRPIRVLPGELVPPPYLEEAFEQNAADALYIDIASHDAPHQMRELAQELGRGRATKAGAPAPASGSQSPPLAEAG